MDSHQINLKMPEGLYKIAKRFADEHEYRSVQELILESLRIRILPKQNVDEDVTPKEQRIIAELVSEIVKKKDFIDWDEYKKRMKIEV